MQLDYISRSSFFSPSQNSNNYSRLNRFEFFINIWKIILYNSNYNLVPFLKLKKYCEKRIFILFLNIYNYFITKSTQLLKFAKILEARIKKIQRRPKQFHRENHTLVKGPFSKFTSFSNVPQYPRWNREFSRQMYDRPRTTRPHHRRSTARLSLSLAFGQITYRFAGEKTPISTRLNFYGHVC